MPDKILEQAARPPLRLALKRAVRFRCPSCGRGHLFRSYLRQVDSCPDCGEAFGHIRTDDAAPWLTILLVGHLLVPSAITAHTALAWPDWVGMIVWPLAAICLSLIILPWAKALFLSAIWTMKAPGSERE